MRNPQSYVSDKRPVEARSALLALCEGNPSTISGFPLQRIIDTDLFHFLWYFHEQVVEQTVKWLVIRYHFGLSHNKATVYPKKYAHGFVVLCFVVVMQSFIMNSREVFIHIHQGCFAGTGAIVRLPQCQWSKPDGYGKTSQCITTTKHSKAKTCAYFLGYTVPVLLTC